MGFGGGAFGTGSYVYSVIDNLTIKLDAISGVIYALGFSFMTVSCFM